MFAFDRELESPAYHWLTVRFWQGKSRRRLVARNMLSSLSLTEVSCHNFSNRKPVDFYSSTTYRIDKCGA
jgi:hypothetical protein